MAGHQDHHNDDISWAGTQKCVLTHFSELTDINCIKIISKRSFGLPLPSCSVRNAYL